MIFLIESIFEKWYLVYCILINFFDNNASKQRFWDMKLFLSLNISLEKLKRKNGSENKSVFWKYESKSSQTLTQNYTPSLSF